MPETSMKRLCPEEYMQAVRILNANRGGWKHGLQQLEVLRAELSKASLAWLRTGEGLTQRISTEQGFELPVWRRPTPDN
jgi:hypothetical protein